MLLSVLMSNFLPIHDKSSGTPGPFMDISIRGVFTTASIIHLNCYQNIAVNVYYTHISCINIFILSPAGLSGRNKRFQAIVTGYTALLASGGDTAVCKEGIDCSPALA
jgi:hypothetical protein